MLVKLVLLAAHITYTRGQDGMEFAPQAPSIQVAHLVPPGQVLLRWKAGESPAQKPPGWRVSHYKLHALDTSTNTSSDFTLYPPSTSSMNTSDGKRHYAHIDEGELGRYSEYRFPKYSLEAGYYTFRLRTCAEDSRSLSDAAKWCSKPSADSSPYVPVPGHTIADFTGDTSSEPPGVPSFVRASSRQVNGTIAVTVHWGDPVPATYTAFVILANPNNNTAERFAVSERLYANRREYIVPANVLRCGDDASHVTSCKFTFQVAAINVMTHGQPSSVSNEVQVSDDPEQAIAWAVPPEVTLSKSVVQDSKGRYVVSWEWNASSPITGFAIQCFKQTDPTVCTGELPPESRSFAFDHTMLESGVWYSFKVQARNIVGGMWSAATEPITPKWDGDQLVTASAVVLLQPPTQLTANYVGRVLHLSWKPPADGLTARVGYKKHSEGSWHIFHDANYTHHNSAVMEGLEDLAIYDFSVSVTNELGGGPWAAPISALVGAQHPDPPSQPMQTTQASKLDRITIGWSMPAFDGGLPIDRYKITVLSQGQTLRVNEYSSIAFASKMSAEQPLIIEVGKRAEYCVTALQPATAYVFRVAAHNQVCETLSNFLHKWFVGGMEYT